jgi:hypothetical protein
MEPVFLDLHIHTSENPNNLDPNYAIETLIGKIKQVSEDSDFLISFTDHNTINKNVYLKAVEKVKNIIRGFGLSCGLGTRNS